MPRLEILVIDHHGRPRRPDTDARQEPGPTIQNYVVHPGDLPGGRRYADFCALSNVWNIYSSNGNEPAFIGFFGYRKYMVADADDLAKWAQPGHAPGFWNCSLDRFRAYQRALAEGQGEQWLGMLGEYDLLQAAPYTVDDVINDFRDTRSQHDAELLGSAAHWKHIQKIAPYLFITRWEVFNRMMDDMEGVRKELDLQITAEDSDNVAYKLRPMAYVMERVYSFWLAGSGLSIKELPLLHCWDL